MPSRVILLMVLLTFIVITFSASITDRINRLIIKLAASRPAAPEPTQYFRGQAARPATPSGSRGPAPAATRAAHAAPPAQTGPGLTPQSTNRLHPWARYAPIRGRIRPVAYAPPSPSQPPAAHPQERFFHRPPHGAHTPERPLPLPAAQPRQRASPW